MKHSYRHMGIAALCLAVATGCGSRQPGAPSAEEERRQARLERGQYLVEHLLDCMSCHSEVHWDRPGAPIVERRAGVGAIFPDEGLPFKIVAPNITPDPETGIGNWSDEQLARAIRDGIGHDGRVLVPVMPYMNYRALSDEDLVSVIVYLRSLPPVRHSPPKIPVPPPVQQSLKAPPPAGSVPPPHVSTPERRGEYLVNIGACSHCHTPIGPDMKPLPGLDYAGGFVLKGAWGEVASANITPDPSGISYYDEGMFVEVMRTGKLVEAREINWIMPWARYRNLNDEDLKAMFAYLRTLKPVSHRVDNTEPPAPCKRCGSTHGLGDHNR